MPVCTRSTGIPPVFPGAGDNLLVRSTALLVLSIHPPRLRWYIDTYIVVNPSRRRLIRSLHNSSLAAGVFYLLKKKTTRLTPLPNIGIYVHIYTSSVIYGKR